MKIRTLAAALASSTCIVAMATPAQAQERAFDIPAGSLRAALDAYGRQAGRPIIYRAEDVRGARSPGYRGTASPEAALDAILTGTGFSARTDSSGAVAVVRMGAAQQGETLAGSAAAEIGSAERGEQDIVVTGTRIRGVQRGASPSLSYDREDFAQSGATSVQQFMRTLPQNFQGGSNETGAALNFARNNGGQNTGIGAGINLRGLGNTSTLVLLDGRRLTPGGLGALVDVSTIPLSALERVDVLLDGASAIYGSDAVGGVVNFVLRDNFEGVEAAIRYGGTTSGGLREFNAHLLGGTNWGSGSVLVNIDYGQKQPLLASERSVTAPLNQGGITYISPEEERVGILVNGHQDLNEALTLSLVAYANHRTATRAVYQRVGARQNIGDSVTDQLGGTLSLDWRVGSDWILSLAQTLAHSEVDRLNYFDPPSGGFSFTRVRAEHEFGSTQIDAEGPLFALPGGQARLALGGERRWESLDLTRVNITNGESRSRTVNAGYLELFVPLIGANNQNVLARRLELTSAVRYEDYNDVGDTTNAKFGLLWEPIRGFNLRGTYGTSFRAPYLYQYDRTLAVGYYFNAANSASPTGTTRVAALVQGSDPDLGPENARTWTAGFDLLPELLFGFRVTGTYFDIDYRDRISAAGLSLAPFTNPQLLPLISQPADPIILAQIAFIQANNPANFLNVTFPSSPLSAAEATLDARARNQARARLRGFDFTIDRAIDTGWGRFNTGLNASYLFEFTQQTLEASPAIDVADTIFNPVDLRVRGYLSWARSGWQASAIVNYTDSYKDNQRATVARIPSWTTVDLGLGYTFERGPTRGLSLRLNVVNAFDRDPPAVTDLLVVPGGGFGNAGYDAENANPLGRIVSLEVTKRW